MGILHMGVSIDFLRAQLTRDEQEARPPDYFTRSDGSVPDYAEARAALDEMEAAGMTLVPTCDNVDARGYCRGHPDRSPES